MNVQEEIQNYTDQIDAYIDSAQQLQEQYEVFFDMKYKLKVVLVSAIAVGVIITTTTLPVLAWVLGIGYGLFSVLAIAAYLHQKKLFDELDYTHGQEYSESWWNQQTDQFDQLRGYDTAKSILPPNLIRKLNIERTRWTEDDLTLIKNKKYENL